MAVKRVKAKRLPVGTVVSTDGRTRLQPTGRLVLTLVDRPGRCPWRIGPPGSLRFVASWRVQELIDDGAAVTTPAKGT